ncbi:MAG: FAD-dependent oxidoreductase [Planctomyces sp.]|nr:FAD-dependent oxidoreductase [Planctomyces sp.]
MTVFEGWQVRVAIIGGGVSGLTAAWLLRNTCEVTLFEQDRRVGGHSNTVSFQKDGDQFSIDTGFIVYNDRTYPHFQSLLAQLGVEGVPTEMSFAVRCEESGTEYCGSNLSGLFAQRSNLFSPKFLRMILDILRFNKIGTLDADAPDHAMTVGEYLKKHRLGSDFADLYLLPMGAAIWSCPTGSFADFPIGFILEFYRNHGLLSIRNRPQWYTIPGGSRRYVDRICQVLGNRLRAGLAVESVIRSAESVLVRTAAGTEQFDEVIFACHSDQALRLLEDASSLERQVLNAFPYEPNEAILHTDESVLPIRRRAWAAWNYRVTRDSLARPTVSYNMNILQHISSRHTFCVTLNDAGMIDPAKIISRHMYSHPVFTLERAPMQARHGELIRNNRTSFCGAYWGNGFHEDGVVSALAVAKRFGIQSINDSAKPVGLSTDSAKPISVGEVALKADNNTSRLPQRPETSHA